MNNRKKKAVRQIKVINQLKAKVGSGGIPKMAIDKSQDFVDGLNVDFTGYVQADLEGIVRNLDMIQRDHEYDHHAFKSIVRHIMQLKANTGMFGYSMISSVSGMVLDVLEKQGAANDDNIQLVRVHNDIVSYVVFEEIADQGGLTEENLMKEFNKAVTRYCDKYFQSP